jgi:hypothetical protein
MKRQVTCGCGAIYQRTEIEIPYRDNGSYACRYCSAVMEDWLGNTLPHFLLLKEPPKSVLPESKEY